MKHFGGAIPLDCGGRPRPPAWNGLLRGRGHCGLESAILRLKISQQCPLALGLKGGHQPAWRPLTHEQRLASLANEVVSFPELLLRRTRGVV